MPGLAAKRKSFLQMAEQGIDDARIEVGALPLPHHLHRLLNWQRRPVAAVAE